MSESPLTGKGAKARVAKYRDAALRGVAGRTKRLKSEARAANKTKRAAAAKRLERKGAIGKKKVAKKVAKKVVKKVARKR